jgi:hypothetical protein
MNFGIALLRWLRASGAGAMGMTITNTSAAAKGGYPSAAFIQFTGTMTTGPIIVHGPGFTSDDGFTGCTKAGPGTVGRWGDYGRGDRRCAHRLRLHCQRDDPEPVEIYAWTLRQLGDLHHSATLIELQSKDQLVAQR